MRKYMYLAAALLLATAFAVPTWAQMEGGVRGVVKDADGKPIAGATIQMYDSATGRKYQLKTNDKGEYRSIGINMGTYKMTALVGGNPIDEHNNVGIGVGQEQVVDFQGGAGRAPVTEEQRKQIEETQKQNEKVKGLNTSLQQAKDLEGAGNFDQAISVLQDATKVDPNQDLIWAYLGDAQRGAAAKAPDAAARTQLYQQAVDSYKKALEIKPTSGAYMGQLAEAYAKTGQTDKAVEEYTAAVTADPENASKYYYNEGVLFTNMGKPDEALAAIDKVIQADPNRAEAYYLKGQNLIAKSTTKGDKMIAPEGTAEAFNKYLELQPNGKFAEVAKQMLAAIGAPIQTNFGKGKSSSGGTTKKKPNQ